MNLHICSHCGHVEPHHEYTTMTAPVVEKDGLTHNRIFVLWLNGGKYEATCPEYKDLHRQGWKGTVVLYVAIIGSRGYPYPDLVRRFVLEYVPEDSVVVTGGAIGVDTWAKEAAEERGLKVKVIGPSQSNPSRAAALMARNRDIVAQSDLVVAFMDQRTPGTTNALKHASNLGRSTLRIRDSLT